MKTQQSRADFNAAEITRRRLAKAQALAIVLEGAGALACEVPLIDAAGRRAAEQLARVHESSDVTWSYAADILGTLQALKGAS